MTDMPPYLSDSQDKPDDSGDSISSTDVDEWDLPLVYDKPRHLEPVKAVDVVDQSWRVKEKYKTHCVALVLCLNVGVDPPDVVKTQPCARLECWIDPLSLSPSKALENIGHALQAQYERWQPRARYKLSLDPTSDEVKKLCCSLRRNAKEERVLFHYNGHGVPRPTPQGEIWVFNRAYTQYIPLSVYDLQAWLGAPSLYVYDCSNAGVILDCFNAFAEQHERDYQQQSASGGGTTPTAGGVSFRNCIQLAACAAGQSLPQHPELPADLFTACLTTPVKCAVRWFVLRHRTRVAPPHVADLVDKIPGQVSDRRTMLGELNWIFTAVTDTIAWSSLPADLFQQLFRADLLTASLARNYLLADRIMRSYNCTPVSSPALPSLAAHPLWGAWDHALDLALAQLPTLLHDPAAEYQHSPFFTDQLTAFQLWTRLGSVSRPPPHQLPMVLQVLLSTLHRVRALRALCRYLALGARATRHVLRVGVFPYMLKLLQAHATDLRQPMCYIWARIVALDPSCQVDLVNAKGHKYFLSVLQDPTVDTEHRTLAAYVLAAIVRDYPPAQELALQAGMVSACLEQVVEGGALAVWACVALGRAWSRHVRARWAAVRDQATDKLAPLLAHPDVEVRCACAFALGEFVGAGRGEARSKHADAVDQRVAVDLCARLSLDAAPQARQEILNALQWVVLRFEREFMAVCAQERTQRSDRARGRSSGSSTEGVDPAVEVLPGNGVGGGAVEGGRHRAPPALQLPVVGLNSGQGRVWRALSACTRDPHPRVAQMARTIVDRVHHQWDSCVESSRSGGSGGGAGDARRSLPPSPHQHDRARHVSGGSVSGGGSGGAEWEAPLVRSEWAGWVATRWAREQADPSVDSESSAHHSRAWRRARNNTLRHHAAELLGARVSRLESVAFHSRCPVPPAALLLHPYEQHAAVASRDNFGVWDWGTGAKVCSGAAGSGGGGGVAAWGRITALAHLNAHHRTHLAVATHTGALHVYRLPAGGGAEPALAAAWRVLDVWPSPARRYRPPHAMPLYSYSLTQLVPEQFLPEERLGQRQRSRDDGADSGGETGGAGGGSGGVSGGAAGGEVQPGTLLSWVGGRRSLAAAGHAPRVALWDAHAELHSGNIDTKSECGVTSLWRGGAGELPTDGALSHTLVCGLEDGRARAWDERDASGPTHSLHHHAAPLLAAQARPEKNALYTVCAGGEVMAHDWRALSRSPLWTARAPAPLAAAAVHPLADLIACGSSMQSVSVLDLRGATLNTIKFHEGFMGARIGPVAALAFHPLRAALCVGTKDSTVSVYVAEPAAARR